MTIKYSKGLAFAGITILTAMMVAPSQAADPIPPAGMGIIIVVHHVINDNAGVRPSSDFQLTLKHWGSDVVGSPFMGSETGTTFTVAPGSYVVTSPVTDGYLGTWSGTSNVAGYIDLAAGQVVTITRTTNDVGVSPMVETPPATTPATDNGGTLPSTATPWFNALAAGMMLSALGAIGVRKFALQNK